MQRAVRPSLTAGVALVGAGLIAAAPITVTSPELRPALHFDSVAPASLVTDLLDDVSAVVDSAANAVTIPINAAIDAPFFAAALLVPAVNDPTLIPSLASFFANRYLNPGLETYGVPGDFLRRVVGPLAWVLPPPLGPTPPNSSTDYSDGLILGAVGAVAGVIDDVLKLVLPDPTPGADAYQVAYTSGQILVRVLEAAPGVFTAPIAALGNIISFVGHMPAQLDRVVEAAVANPAEIPNLLSGVVRSVIDPGYWAYDPHTSVHHYGLLAGALEPFVGTLDTLPAPIGTIYEPNFQQGAARAAYTGFKATVGKFLDQILPAPITPPWAASVQSAAGSAVTSPAAARAAVTGAGSVSPDTGTAKQASTAGATIAEAATVSGGQQTGGSSADNATPAGGGQNSTGSARAAHGKRSAQTGKAAATKSAPAAHAAR